MKVSHLVLPVLVLTSAGAFAQPTAQKPALTKEIVRQNALKSLSNIRTTVHSILKVCDYTVANTLPLLEDIAAKSTGSSFGDLITVNIKQTTLNCEAFEILLSQTTLETALISDSAAQRINEINAEMTALQREFTSKNNDYAVSIAQGLVTLSGDKPAVVTSENVEEVMRETKFSTAKLANSTESAQLLASLFISIYHMPTHLMSAANDLQRVEITLRVVGK